MAKEEQIKSQIILEGEKEYRAACKGINTSLREIGSEMKLATAEFGDNAESIEALTRKQDILQKQLDEQAKKAKAAEAALKKMREGGIDPTDPAYQKMQTNLNNTRAEMVKVQRELDDTSKKLKSSKIDWESVGDTVGKVGKAIGVGVAAMGAAIGAAATAFLGLAESTREARENMGKLEAGFTTAGHSAEDAKNTYTELYGILGDDGQATEAAAHLAQLTNNEQELATWTDIATGVYATFGDSLPIENLTEAANETAKTGQITGGLADALNWAGVSEDEFQSKLDACTTEQERQALITETLNGLYSDAAEAYREVNGDIIEAQKATANLNSAMAALGAIAEPIVTKLKQLAADLLQQITPFVELIGTGLTGALEGAEGAAQQFSEGLLGLVTFIVEQLGTMLPTFLEFALQMIGTLATGIAQATGKPLVAVNHLEGHALVPRLHAAAANGMDGVTSVEFPYLLMLASGGHCQILLVRGVGQYEMIGQTLDDSAGEAFDKIAKMLGLGYPGGPVVDRRAAQGNPKAFDFPRPLCDKPGCDFSFSGIKTAARTFLSQVEPPYSDELINDFCASFQAAVVDCIINRLNNAFNDARVIDSAPKTLVVAGGVAKNSAVRSAMENLAKKHNVIFAAPPMNLCTDNGAMIAWAGLENYRLGKIVKEPVAPRPRWPLTEL